MKAVLKPVYAFMFPNAYKRREELAFWRGRFSAENGNLSNKHYKALYTTAYELTEDDFAGKVILDIGCGPRGSLEWANLAKERVGLDPLVPEYLNLGADKHKMEYIAASSDDIPFADGYFDIVTCINALDHVDDFEKTVKEIKRVTRSGGLFLLSTEIDHPPTATEPIIITAETLKQFGPEFVVTFERLVGTPENHNLHRAVVQGKPLHEPGKPGIYVAKMQKR